MPDGQYSKGQLDAIARQQGFQNYEQWAAWDRNTRQQVLSPGAAGAPEQPKNWLQTLLESIPGHPAMTLKYVNDKITKALGGKK